MDNTEVKNIISKYNHKLRISFLITVFICAIILFLQINLILKITLAVLFFIITTYLASKTIRKKHIDSILLNELNPQKYFMVISGTNLINEYAFDEIAVSLHIGDYNAAINICNQKTNNKKTARLNCVYLTYLARAYFDMCDWEELKNTCDKFEKMLSEIKKPRMVKALQKTCGPSFEYYKKFLSGDYSGCKAVLLNKNDNSDKNNNNKINIITTHFLYAITCYKLGELTEAKEKFNYIVNEAPLLYCSEISKKYINAIENNTAFNNGTHDIKIEDDYQTPQRKLDKSVNRKGAVGIIALIALFVIICYASITTAPSTPEKALKYSDSMTEIIATHEMENKDLLCFYDTKYDGYCFSYLEYVKDNKYRVKFTSDNIVYGYMYGMGIPKIDKSIEFTLYDDTDDPPENNCLIKEFQYDGEPIFFCITAIKNEETKFFHSSMRMKDYEF